MSRPRAINVSSAASSPTSTNSHRWLERRTCCWRSGSTSCDLCRVWSNCSTAGTIPASCAPASGSSTQASMTTSTSSRTIAAPCRRSRSTRIRTGQGSMPRARSSSRLARISVGASSATTTNGLGPTWSTRAALTPHAVRCQSRSPRGVVDSRPLEPPRLRDRTGTEPRRQRRTVPSSANLRCGVEPVRRSGLGPEDPDDEAEQRHQEVRDKDRPCVADREVLVLDHAADVTDPGDPQEPHGDQDHR